MDFGFDQTQQEIAEVTANILDRAAEQTETVGWRTIVDGGLLALGLPGEYGGDDLGLSEVGVVLAEVGRRAMATPVLTTLALGALPLARSGTPAQQEAYLPRVAKDGLVLTAALHEPSHPLPVRPRTRARPDGDRFVVTGTKVAVPYGDRADRVLVPVSIEGAGTGLLIVNPWTAGVRLIGEPSAGHEPHHRLALDEVVVPATDLVGELDDGRAVTDLYRVALVAAALTADGLLAGALALTAEHVATRQQFGRPLATLQAVAQQIADVYVASRTLHLAAWSASRQLAEASVAAYWVADQLRPALAICHHLHGGLGVDDRYPLHRFAAAAAELTRFVGGPDRGLDRLADDLFGHREG
jgi:alkylation response protein AidB-like acyl-CoA dehydrogenase